MAAAVRTDNESATLRQPVDTERREKHMQQACVIGVFDVFEIELPVVRQYLGKAAGDDRRLVHHALDAGCNLFAQIFLDRRYVASRLPKTSPANSVMRNLRGP